MNILVTGGAGYVGSVCVEELLRRGHRVVAFDNLAAGFRAAVAPGAIFVRGKISDAAALNRACRNYKIEAVMHFAASALVEESVLDPALFYRNNVASSLTLLDVLLENKIKKLVFSSSAATYGEPESVPIREDHRNTPINPYGETKLVIERALAWYHAAYGLNFAALRYFNAAGATKLLGEDHRPETHLIPRLLRVAADSRAVFSIYGDDYPTPDGTCVRDFVHVLDIAQAHILALERLFKPGALIYNVGLGHGYSIREAVEAAERCTGRKIRVKTAPRRAGDPAVLVASPDKIRQELGWNPRHSDLANILSTAWQWRQLHPRGYTAEEASGKTASVTGWRAGHKR